MVRLFGKPNRCESIRRVNRIFSIRIVNRNALISTLILHHVLQHVIISQPDLAARHSTSNNVDRLSLSSGRERQTVYQVSAFNASNQTTINCVQHQTTAGPYTSSKIHKILPYDADSAMFSATIYEAQWPIAVLACSVSNVFTTTKLTVKPECTSVVLFTGWLGDMKGIQPEQISLQGELLGTWLMLKVFWKSVTVTLIQIHLVGIAKLSTLVQKTVFLVSKSKTNFWLWFWDLHTVNQLSKWPMCYHPLM